MAINNNYVEFCSTTPFTLRTTSGKKAWDGYIRNYINNQNWINGSISSTLSDGFYVIRLRGASNSYLCGQRGGDTWIFEHSDPSDNNIIFCEGYLETLLSTANGFYPYCCKGMFKNNTLLVSALSIRNPRIRCRDYCFYEMYSGCTRLSTVPQFTASDISFYSFYRMFYGCTSLRSIPDFFDVNIRSTADYACYEMFAQCISLRSSPTIYTTRLGKYSCARMFYNCASLSSAGNIYAESVGDYGCESMFSHCLSLTTPPVFYPISLGKHCFENMFSNTRLNSLIILPSKNLPEACYKSMFNGTQIILNESSSQTYSFEYKIPFSRNAVSSSSDSLKNMFNITPEINTTYYSNAQVINQSFNISFHDNSQERDTVDTVSVSEYLGDYLRQPETLPTRTGYTFSNWSTSAAGTDVYTEDTQLVSVIDSLYAQWTANQYNLIFDSQGAEESGTTSIIVTYDEKLSSIQIPTKKGYLFGGYFSDTDGSGLQYYTSQGTSNYVWEQTEDLILYAFWIDKSSVETNHSYTKGVFDKYMRVATYQSYKDSNRYTNNDFIGYVDKDMEYFLNK